jgi:hypothetical protein
MKRVLNRILLIYVSVGVMKDEELKMRDLHVSKPSVYTGLCGGLEHLKIGDLRKSGIHFFYHEEIHRELNRILI